MKTIYVADDGKKFDNLEDCKKYEGRASEKEKRRKELDDLYNKFYAALKQYCKDYPDDYEYEYEWF